MSDSTLWHAAACALAEWHSADATVEQLLSGGAEVETLNNDAVTLLDVGLIGLAHVECLVQCQLEGPRASQRAAQQEKRIVTETVTE